MSTTRTFDFKTDITAVWDFIRSHPAMLGMFFLLQWISNLMLSRSTRLTLSLLQRIVLAIIITIVVFVGNQMISEGDEDVPRIEHFATSHFPSL